jgi:hypothetical protein
VEEHIFLLDALVIVTMKGGRMVYRLEDEAGGPRVRRFRFPSDEEGAYPLEDEAGAKSVH